MSQRSSWFDVVAWACVVVLFIILLVACAGAAAVYGAERSLCVEQHDAAPAARECIRKVDEKWQQDGGVK
jgi:hypothetical protein